MIAGTGSAASVIAGRLLVSGATSDVTLAGLRVDTTATGGPPCRLFADGFESSGTLAWSAAEP